MLILVYRLLGEGRIKKMMSDLQNFSDNIVKDFKVNLCCAAMGPASDGGFRYFTNKNFWG